MSLRVLDLFSGIGGFSLGLERTGGFKTVAFCEIDPFCRRVLAKYWPDVPCHDDVTTREFQEGEADVICGGFPCQDISNAGQRAGIAGERSGLYRHLVRAIRLVRPRFAILENVAALLVRGMGTVLGDLAEIGNDAEWHCIPASAVGAPHRRDRVWIIAADPSRGGYGLDGGGQARARQPDAAFSNVDHAERAGLQACRARGNENDGAVRSGAEHPGYVQAPAHASSDMADTIGPRLEGRPILSGYLAEELAAIERNGSGPAVAHADGAGCAQSIWAGEALPGARQGQSPGPERSGRHPWLVEPDVGRVAHGVRARVDRLRSLGNAVVPQIPEMIGNAILSASVSKGG